MFKNKNLIAALALGVVVSTASASAACFTTNLSLGKTHAQVKTLQEVLNDNGFEITASGSGSAGNETTYFGAKTKIAVQKFQKSNSLPATGNVFSLTRAALNDLCEGVDTPANPGSTTPVTPKNPTTGTSTTPVTSGSVSVSLAANQSVNTVLVAGSARNKLADLVFTGNGIVTGLSLQRIGLSNNDTLTNVYLYDGTTRVGDAVSVNSNGQVNWNYSNGIFLVSGSKTISVYADIKASTSGQSAGVALNSFTVQGATAPAVVSNVAGPVWPVGNVTLADVKLGTVTPGATDITAGTPNVVIWSSNVQITSSNNSQGVNFSGLTLKAIGSAPQNAFANYKLYVDGVQQAVSSTGLDNNGRVTFAFNPILLRTGSRSIEVRADNLAGSGRTVQFTIESTGDALFSDSSYNAYISAVLSNGNCSNGWTISCAQTGVITIGKGSLSIQADPSFNTSRVIGGASQVTIAKFIARAYGEDARVYNLDVTPTLSNVVPSNTGLKNVALYLNGGQIGTQQNWTSGPVPFTFNNQFVVPAGTSVTLEVKADTYSNNNNVAYTAGSVRADIVNCTSYGNGINGQNSSGLQSTCNAVGINTLSIGSADGSFSASGATNRNISPNQNDQNIGSFSFQAGQSEGLVLNNVNVTLSGSVNLNDLRNVRLLNGSTTLGSAFPNAASNMSFSGNSLTVAPNTSITLNLVADVANTSNSSTTVVTATAQFRGQSSNVTSNTNVPTNSITSTARLASFVTPINNDEQDQFVVGGSKQSTTFSVKTANGSTIINELKFKVNGKVDAIQSLSINNGSPISKDSSNYITITGLSIPVSDSLSSINVGIQTVCIGSNSGCYPSSLGANNSASVTLVAIKSNQSNVNTSVVSMVATGNAWDGSVPTKNISVVSSRPSLVSIPSNVVTFNSGTQKIGEVSITADANGAITVTRLAFKANINVSGVTLTSPFLSLGDSNSNPANGVTPTLGALSNNAYPISFEIATSSATANVDAGTTKKFNVYALVGGSYTLPNSSVNVINTQFDKSNFVWQESVSDATSRGYAGLSIPNDSNSYSLRN